MFGNPTQSSGLQIANNLSDLANAATARTNLGLGTGDSPQFTALGLGTANTGIGKLQFSASTNSADGIALGADFRAYRVAVGGIGLDGTTGMTVLLSFYGSGIRKGYLQAGGGALKLLGEESELQLGANGTPALTLHSTLAATFESSIKTGAPSGSAQPMKFGGIVAGAVALDAANYWEVSINGTVKKVLLAA